MQTNTFKSTQRSPRAITVEELFNGGMQYTNAPLPEGFCKTLVNFDFKDRGNVLVPRNGLQCLPEATYELDNTPYPLYCHHVGQTRVTFTASEDDVRRYILLVQNEDTDYFDYDNMIMLIEDSLIGEVPNLVPAILDVEAHSAYRILANPKVAAKQIHDMPYVGMHNIPVHASLNNITYLPASWIDDDTEERVSGLARLEVVKDADDADYVATLTNVTPKLLSPTEAVNYGYNMLSKTPYTFNDVINEALPANYIILEGILPYRDATCTELLMDAKVGAWLTFRLYAQFPDTASTYKFRWEIRDLDSDSVTVYEAQDSALSKVYHYDNTRKCAIDGSSGKYITLTLQPPYHRFSIVVTAYSTEDLTEPIQVIALASYNLTADNSKATKGITMQTYDLSTITGMCTWANRIVAWGVKSAKNMLFVSDINDPSYFPYPNNVDIFEEEVIACVPYLSDLLVFTESQLHRLVWAADGLSFTSTIIQDKLMLSPLDSMTVRVVKNMVFFKNGNHYYMIVPNPNNMNGDLQLAPISTPITNLLDNFKQEIKDILFTMYNPEMWHVCTPEQYLDIALIDYHNYLDVSVMRNVYKLQINVMSTQEQLVQTLCHLDVTINYDTTLRTWSLYVCESNLTNMLPYRQTVTSSTIYLNLVSVEEEYPVSDEPDAEVIEGYSNTLELVCPSKTVGDNFTLALGITDTGRRIKNWQYLDTGYRDHSTHMKKRYRELQFKINNVSQQALQFGTEFMIDDDLRRNLFNYDVKQITDDPSDTSYGYLYVERSFANPVTVPGATILDNVEYTSPAVPTGLTSGDVLHSNKWVLGFSKLSKVTVLKIRFPVSGKGYSPRLKLLSFNEQPYEYLSHNWVYRNMYAR